MACFLPFALIEVAASLAVLATGIPFLFPISIALLLLAGVPYAKWLSKHINDSVAYEFRDHSLNEGEEKPWESEDGSVTEDEMLDIILNSDGRGSINP
jgi:hypothetical protein